MATKSGLSKLKDKVAKKLPKLNRAEKFAALGTVVSVGTAIYALSQSGAGSNRSANTDGTLSINKDELISAIKSDSNLQNLLRGYSGSNGSNGIIGTNGIDGVNGKDGINGIDGVNGKDGINGQDGTKIYSFQTLLDLEDAIPFAYRVDDLFLVLENGTLYRKTVETIPPNASVSAFYTSVMVLKGANGTNATIGNLVRYSGTNTLSKNDSVVMSLMNGPNPSITTVNTLNLPSLSSISDKFICKISCYNTAGCDIVLPTVGFNHVQPWGSTVAVSYSFVDANGLNVSATTKHIDKGQTCEIYCIYDSNGKMIFYTNIINFV